MTVLRLSLNDIQKSYNEGMSFPYGITELRLVGVLGHLDAKLAQTLKEKLPIEFTCPNLVFEDARERVTPLQDAMAQIESLQSHWGFKHLGLNRCGIGDDDIEALGSLSFVSSLSLNNNELKGDKIVQLIPLARHLERLNLSNNLFANSAEIFLNLIEALTLSKIETLKFKHNRLEGSLERVANFLMNESTNLKKLDISHNRLAEAGVDSMLPWLRTMGAQTDLAKVDLSHNGWTVDKTLDIERGLRGAHLKTRLNVEDEVLSYPFGQKPVPVIYSPKIASYDLRPTEEKHGRESGCLASALRRLKLR